MIWKKKRDFVLGLDELKKEIDLLGKARDIWPPKERWVACIGSSTYLGPDIDVYKYGNKNLEIIWFQEGGNPMDFLESIVSEIDFNSLWVAEITEEYDFYG